MPQYLNKTSGTLTAAGSVTLPFRHTENGGVGFQITGISGDTVTFEATIDGTNWVALLVTSATAGTTSTTTTADGIFSVNAVGLLSVRARVSTYSAGTVVITIVANPGK